VIDELNIIGADRIEAAFSFGDAITSIVVDIDVAPLGLQKPDLTQDLVGEHGVAKGDQHITSLLTARVRISTKLVAAELAVVLGRERDLLEPGRPSTRRKSGRPAKKR